MYKLASRGVPLRHYDDFINAFLEYTAFVEAPESFLKWSAVSVISGALERKTWINFKRQKYCHPNHYIMLVGPPGLVRKSTSAGLAVDLLAEAEATSMLATQFTPAALILQMKRAGKRKVTFDQEYVNSSVYLYSSEAINSLKEKEGGVIQLLTDLYDCGPNGWSTKACWSKETKQDGSIKIFNPCISFLGCSVPDWLVRSIGKEDLQSGFASRCLFIVENSRPDRDYDWDDDLPDRSIMRPKLIEDLRRISTLSGEYKPTKKFKKYFSEFDKDNKNFLESNQDDALFGYWARKPWHLLKLTQVLQASKSDEMILDLDTLEYAFKFLSSAESCMSEAFGNLDRSFETEALVDMFKKVRKIKTNFTKKSLLANFLNYDMKTIDAVVARLVAMGRVMPIRAQGEITYEILDSRPIK